MTYQVMARKWRPQTFEEVIAQEHATKTLQNAINTGRIGHAYLFSGPRGVGKTTVARILAKALNCQQGPTPTPCNKCNLCKEITEDRSLDVLEIDGASNRKIDDIRELRANVKYSPASGKYKVIIIDEVHQLTPEAFNALLKTLEEPPAHVIFIFATTEPQKIPLTIQSRCQRFDFRRIPTSLIKDRLIGIAAQEQIQAEESALALIARRAEGSMRDGLSLLDQVVSYGGNQITEKLISEALGLASREVFFHLLDAVHAKNPKEVLHLMATVEEHGWDMEDFAGGLEEHLRNLFLSKIDPGAPELKDLSLADQERYAQQNNMLEEEDVLRMLTLTSETQRRLRYSSRPKFLLEMLGVKLAKMDDTIQLRELLEELDRLLSHKTTETTEPLKEPPVRAVASSSEPARQTPPVTGVTGELWNQVVDRVTKKKLALGVLLQHGQLGDVQEGVVTISFPRSCNFHRERAQMRPNREVIEGEASTLLGREVRVRFTLADGVEPKKLSRPEAESKESPSSSEKLIKAEPIIGNILETLDGEIIE